MARARWAVLGSVFLRWLEEHIQAEAVPRENVLYLRHTLLVLGDPVLVPLDSFSELLGRAQELTDLLLPGGERRAWLLLRFPCGISGCDESVQPLVLITAAEWCGVRHAGGSFRRQRLPRARCTPSTGDGSLRAERTPWTLRHA